MTKQMMMVFSAIFFSLAGSPLLLAQQDIFSDLPIFQSSFTQVGVAAWGAGGTYVTRRDDPAAAFNNPAGLSHTNVNLYIEGGRRLKADYVGLDLDNQYILPGFAVLALPVGKFGFAVGYKNLYDLKIDSHLEVNPEPAADGTGAILLPKNRLRIRSFFASIAYGLSAKLSIGLTSGLSYLDDKQEFKGTDFLITNTGPPSIRSWTMNFSFMPALRRGQPLAGLSHWACLRWTTHRRSLVAGLTKFL